MTPIKLDGPQFVTPWSLASSRLHILRVCKLYGYSSQELTLLFDSLIISVYVCH